MVSQSKLQQVKELDELLSSAQNFALVKYDKTTHKSLEELRKNLRTAQSSIRVVKNTLLQKALQSQSQSRSELKELVQQAFPLRESTAFLSLGEDYATGLKAFHEFAKKDSTLSFKVGVLEQTVYLNDALEKIAKLPGKSELMAKLIGGLKSPSSKLVYALKFNITKLTLVLKERAKQTN